MSDGERQRLEAGSAWYLEEQLDFDKALLGFRFDTIRPWLKGPRGLELGPAEGLMSALLVGAFDHLTVVEGSQTLLDEIPDAANLNKVRSLFEDFTPDAPFDTIVLYYVLEHVADPVDLLGRVRSWLAPGGRAIVGVPNAESFHRLAAVKMGLLATPAELNPRDHALGHRRVYTWPELADHLAEAGLGVVERLGVFFKPLSNGQIQAQWTAEMIRGFYELGRDFPANAADLVAVCERRDR